MKHTENTADIPAKTSYVRNKVQLTKANKKIENKSKYQYETETEVERKRERGKIYVFPKCINTLSTIETAVATENYERFVRVIKKNALRFTASRIQLEFSVCTKKKKNMKQQRRR